MAEYSMLSQKEVKTILSNYDITELRSCEILSGGFQNTNFAVVTEKGKFVLTICEEKSVEDTLNLAGLLEHLASNNFITSRIIRSSKNEPICFWNGKPLMLKSYLTGKIMEELPNHLLECVGSELSKLHKIEAPDYLPTVLSYGKENFYEVEEYAAGSPYHFWLKNIEQYIEQYMHPNLPKALIHSDVFSSNIIVSEDERTTTIMDFEEVTYYYRVFDLGMTIVGLCRVGKTINIEKMNALLKGYYLGIQLRETELKVLQHFTVYAAAAMSFWRHKHYNFTFPNPAFKDHYLELKHIADHVKDLPAGVFVIFE